MYRPRHSLGYELAVIAALLVFSLLVMAGCGAIVPESKAVNAAKDAGYTDIEIVDRTIVLVGLLGCGGGDTARFTVRGTHLLSGEVREFYVCASFLKGGTIRSK